MADAPPADPPPDPPPDAQPPTEAALPETEDAKRLYLAAETVRQRAKTLAEELTQAMERLDVPLKPEDES